jgi:hypothetical protein
MDELCMYVYIYIPYELFRIAIGMQMWSVCPVWKVLRTWRLPVVFAGSTHGVCKEKLI